MPSRFAVYYRCRLGHCNGCFKFKFNDCIRKMILIMDQRLNLLPTPSPRRAGSSYPYNIIILYRYLVYNAFVCCV